MMNKKYLIITLALILSIFAASLIYTASKKEASPVDQSNLILEKSTKFKLATEECGKKIPQKAEADAIKAIIRKCLEEKGFGDADFRDGQ